MLNNKSFLELLRELHDDGNLEFEVRSYSGRGMYGDSCIAVVGDLSAWTLALALADINGGNIDLFDLPAPREDSMGLGYVYYWPNLRWPEGEKGFGGDDEGDDEC
jgi:hypothetical protein